MLRWFCSQRIPRIGSSNTELGEANIRESEIKKTAAQYNGSTVTIGNDKVRIIEIYIPAGQSEAAAKQALAQWIDKDSYWLSIEF